MSGVIRTREWWWVPIDPRDIHQERALARLEGRDEDEAAREWIRRERAWYRVFRPFPDGDQDYVDNWVEKFYAAVATKVKPNRSAASVEQRKAYVREWWRKNGKEYRQRRKKAEYAASQVAYSEAVPVGTEPRGFINQHCR